ncbi:MAG: MolR family transcriptional regulator [Thermoprotei archaeon]|nr:MAG: MolR family transcriptional regulator [Thermoprotei archaeon]
MAGGKAFLEGLEARATLLLEKEGVTVLDERTAILLMLTDRLGSMLAAAKALGMAYSRAWEAVARIERVLGVKVVEAKRGGKGGGGAKLTPEGKELLELYVEECLKHLRRPLEAPSAGFKAPALVYAGSHDLLVERIVGLLRSKGVESVEVAWVGSSGGLALLMLNEADVAGVHLYDPASRTYNLPYLPRYWLEGRVVVVRGYDRELVFAMREEVEDPVGELLRGRLRLVNRNLGSGTRVLLDHLLERRAIEEGLDSKAAREVKGYGFEAKTHLDVARAIARGEGDVGLTTRWAAEQYGLKFKHVAWERFDFVIPRSRLEKEGVRGFIEALLAKELREMAEALGGYKVPDEIGKVIYSETPIKF